MDRSWKERSAREMRVLAVLMTLGGLGLALANLLSPRAPDMISWVNAIGFIVLGVVIYLLFKFVKMP